MAGLPGSKAWVCVGPPLFASGPRSGLALVMSPVPVRPQLVSLERLWPADVMELEHSGPTLPAMIVFLAVSVPLLLMPGEFSVTVLLLMNTVPLFRTPPPELAELPLIVLLLMVVVEPVVLRIPPPVFPAELPVTVLLLRVSEPPPRLPMPAPVLPASLPVIKLLFTVSMP